MTERIKGLIERLPGSLTALAVAGAAIAGAASAGFAVRGTFAEQMDLPREVAAFEVRVDSALDSLGARIDSTSAQVRELVRAQQDVTRRLDRLICLMTAEERGEPAYGCEAAP